jgi:hypothetical protein
VERGCVYPEQVHGIEDSEGFFPGEFAGEEEWWFWNAVLFGHWTPTKLVKDILIDADPQPWR